MSSGSSTSRLSHVDFAQTEPLTTRLHGLIRSYPRGVGLVQEFVQNADDAGADAVGLWLDERDHSVAALPSPRMAALQGPALVVTNDAEFSEDDWARLQTIGRSSKTLDSSKTGRFGLGFNSVYNVTDFPGVLSGDRVGIFDPHGQTVDGATPQQPGRGWRLDAALWEVAGDIVEPFVAFGLGRGDTHFRGTAFRLPLRTPEQAQASDICGMPFGSTDFNAIVNKLGRRVSELLLFLNNVTTITFGIIDSVGQRTQLLAVRTLRPETIRSARAQVHSHVIGDHESVLARIRDIDGDLTTTFTHDLEVTESASVTTESWLITRGLFRGPDNELVDHAERMYALGEKAVPLAGAASLISSSDGREVSGRVYCGLPLPPASPVAGCHINGFFDLQADRQGLFEDREAEGGAAVRVEWNSALIEHACAQALAIHVVARARADLAQPYRLWPLVPAETRNLLDALPEWTYIKLCSHECILAGGSPRWRRPCEVLLLPSDSTKELKEALLADDFVIPNPSVPTAVVRGFKAAGHPLRELTPAVLRDALRDADIVKAFEPSNARRDCLSKREWILALLQHCVGDGDLAALKGVPLALLASGTTRTFEATVCLAGAQERSIFKARPEWFLDVEAEQLPGLDTCQAAGLVRMTPQMVLQNLGKVLPAVGDDGSVDNVPGSNTPSSRWLAQVFTYLALHHKECKLKRDVIETLPMVPDQFGRLRAMGRSDTPLLASADDHERLGRALKFFNVPVVSGDPDLVTAIREFVGVYPDDAIWRIEPRDLIDTINAMDGPQHSMDLQLEFDLATHGAVLDVLCRKHGVAALKGAARDRIDVLRALRLFSTVTGAAVSLQGGDYYIPDDYELPDLGIEVGLLWSGPKQRWASLLEALGVPRLTRYRFIMERLVPRLAGFNDRDLISASLWLRQHLHAVREGIDEEEDDKLMERLSAELPVLCSDGERRPVATLYHPAADFVRPLLGTVAGFPDVQLYGERRELWLEFFGALGMTETPRADDVVAAVDHILAETDPERHDERTESLTGIAHYLDDNWESMRDEVVYDDKLQQPDSDEWHLSDALSQRSWLPTLRRAPRGVPNELLVSPTVPFGQPGSLFARASFDLVSGIHPVCSLERISRLASSIGVQSEPIIDDVIRQLELVCQWQLGQGPSGVSASVGRMLRSIYRFLGRAFPTDVVPLDERPEVRELRDRVRELPCIIDGANTLHRPGLCFAEPVSEFLGRAARVCAQDSGIDRGLIALGRRDTPDVEDYSVLFHSLYEEWGETDVGDAERPMVRRAMQRASQLSEPGALKGAPVLTSAGRLSTSAEIVLDDAPWLSERFAAAGVQSLDTGLGRDVAVAFAISMLSSAVYEQSVSEVPSTNASFLKKCESLAEQIQSSSFASGVERLLVAAGNRVRKVELDAFFDGLSVIGVRRMVTVLVWMDGGATIDGSKGEADVLFDPERNSLLVSEAADSDGVLDELVADAIVHELECDEYEWGDMGVKLLSILRCDPDRIQRHLDRLKVPRLPETQDADEQLPDEDSGLIDDDDVPSAETSDASSDDERERLQTGVVSDEEAGAEGRETDTEKEGGVDEKPGNSTAVVEHASAHGRATSDARGERDTVANGAVPSGPRTRNVDVVDSPTGDDATEEIGDVDEGTRDRAHGATPGTRGRVRPRGQGQGHSMGSGPRHPRTGQRSGERAWTAVTRVSREGEAKADEPPERQAKRRRVDQAAVRRVLAFEQERGRRAKEMAHENQGYDIESYSPDGKLERYIEVKGLSGAWSGFNVSISRAQHKKATRERASFWLYVVEFALEPDRSRVFAIQDPGELIDQYWFDDGWKTLSKERAGPGTGASPTVGSRVIIDGGRRGVVKAVRSHGALQHLKIEFEDGQVQSLVYTPRRITVEEPGGGE